jgi:hypothetical protein
MWKHNPNIPNFHEIIMVVLKLIFVLIVGTILTLGITAFLNAF